MHCVMSVHLGESIFRLAKIKRNDKQGSKNNCVKCFVKYVGSLFSKV